MHHIEITTKRPTYLPYFHSLEISRDESIVSIAHVITKVSIHAHLYLHCVPCSCNAVYLTSIRFVPGECWCRNTICLARQLYCLTNPRLVR